MCVIRGAKGPASVPPFQVPLSWDESMLDEERIRRLRELRRDEQNWFLLWDSVSVSISAQWHRRGGLALTTGHDSRQRAGDSGTAKKNEAAKMFF